MSPKVTKKLTSWMLRHKAITLIAGLFIVMNGLSFANLISTGIGIVFLLFLLKKF